MLVTPLGILIEVRDSQQLKALYLTLVMPLGIVIEVRDLHKQKAPSPILLTPLGILIEVRDLHHEFVALIDNHRVASDTVEKC